MVFSCCCNLDLRLAIFQLRAHLIGLHLAIAQW